MHTLGKNPNEAERLQPVKEMFSQKIMNFAVVARYGVTLLEVMSPIAARMLDLWWKELADFVFLYSACQDPWMLKIADVFLELQHEVETIGKYIPVCLCFADQELQI